MIVFSSLKLLAEFYKIDRRKAKRLYDRGQIAKVAYMRSTGSNKELVGYCMVANSIKSLIRNFNSI